MKLRAAIEGVGYYLPSTRVTTEDVNRRIFEATQFKLTNGLLERLTGVKTRHQRDPDENCSDLAASAAERALEHAGTSKDEVDLVIFAACTQDITEPATANIVQEKLGTMKAHVFDIKNACNSFLNGLDVADSLIRTGKARCAVVATGETLSLGIDWAVESVEDLRSRLGSLTLGDAGAAAVLRAVPEDDNRGVLETRFRSFGDRWRLATVMSGGSMHPREPDLTYFRCESQVLRESAYELIPDVVSEVLESTGWDPAEIDVVCGHQVTHEMVHGLQERCGLPRGSAIVTVEDCGNTAAASIPLCLGRAQDEGKLTPGAKVLLVGGAAGFSVGVLSLIW